MPSSVALSLVSVAALAMVGSVSASSREGSSSPALRWFHGTTVPAAISILRQGPRGRSDLGRSFMAPLQGRVYLSRELPYALAYTFGGLTEAEGGVLRTSGRAIEGGLVEVGVDLDRCVPDEDWLGELMMEVVVARKERSASRPGIRAPSPKRGGAAFDLAHTAFLHLSAETQRRWMAYRGTQLDEYSIWARSGKTAIRQLERTRAGRELLRALTDLAPHVACEQDQVHPLRGWVLRRADLHRLSPDGQNLDTVGAPLASETAA